MREITFFWGCTILLSPYAKASTIFSFSGVNSHETTIIFAGHLTESQEVLKITDIVDLDRKAQIIITLPHVPI